MIDPERLTVTADKLREDLPILTAVHAAVKAGLEQAREAKALGSSLQCSVNITADDKHVMKVLHEYSDELDVMFVVSHVAVNQPEDSQVEWCYSKIIDLQGTPAGSIHVMPPVQGKCSRCWRYLAEQEDGLCHRCEAVVGDAAVAA